MQGLLAFVGPLSDIHEIVGPMLSLLFQIIDSNSTRVPLE